MDAFNTNAKQSFRQQVRKTEVHNGQNHALLIKATLVHDRSSIGLGLGLCSTIKLSDGPNLFDRFSPPKVPNTSIDDVII